MKFNREHHLTLERENSLEMLSEELSKKEKSQSIKEFEE